MKLVANKTFPSLEHFTIVSGILPTTKGMKIDSCNKTDVEQRAPLEAEQWKETEAKIAGGWYPCFQKTENSI